MTSCAFWLAMGLVSWTAAGVLLGHFLASDSDRAPDRQP